MSVKGLIVSLLLVLCLCLAFPSYSTSRLTACYGNFPPYSEAGENGVAHGAVVDLFLSVIRELDPAIKVDFLVVPFARCLQMLESGQADMAPMLAFDEARTAYIDFTQAYDHTSLVAVSTKPSLLDYQSIAQIPRNKYILIKPRGTIIWPELANSISSGQFIEIFYPVDHVQALKMLRSARGDMVIIEKYNAGYLLNRMADPSLNLGALPLYRLPIHFGMSKQSQWRYQFDEIDTIIGEIATKPYYLHYSQTLSNSIQ